MNDGNELAAKGFFELGVTFGQFSATPDDHEKYNQVARIASSLQLQLPKYDCLKNQLWWEFAHPIEWYGESYPTLLKNCYDIGMLTYLRFLLSLPPNPNSRTVQINETEGRLKDLFISEDLPINLLEDYFGLLRNSDVSEVNESLKKFVRDIIEALRDKSTQLIESIFENLNPDPPQFPTDILEALKLTIREASKCYEHGCYMATIILCGRAIETLVAIAYEVMFCKRALGADGPGFKVMRETLKSKNLVIDTTLDEFLKLIYKYRSRVSHGDPEIKLPTQEQAKGIAILTEATINITFDYFRDLPGGAIPRPGNNPTEGGKRFSNRSDKNAKPTTTALNQAEANQVTESPSGCKKRFRGMLINWYPDRFFGFIKCNDVPSNVYVSGHQFNGVDTNSLKVRQVFTFEIQQMEKGPAAYDVKPA